MSARFVKSSVPLLFGSLWSTGSSKQKRQGHGRRQEPKTDHGSLFQNACRSRGVRNKSHRTRDRALRWSLYRVVDFRAFRWMIDLRSPRNAYPDCNLRNTKEASYFGLGECCWHYFGGLAEVFGFGLVSWRRFLGKFSCLGDGFCHQVLVSGAFGCRKPS